MAQQELTVILSDILYKSPKNKDENNDVIHLLKELRNKNVHKNIRLFKTYGGDLLLLRL